MGIQYVSYHQVDKQKWDACITNSRNGLIYAHSVYLNAMASNWDALVYGDYEAVMPLPWRKKWRIHYIYPPAFIQQLGIFSTQPIDAFMVDQFIACVPKHIKYAEINFNHANETTHLNTLARKNYILPLNSSYTDLKKAYSRSAKRNINKAIKNEITITEQANPSEIIFLHRQRFKDSIGATADEYLQFEKLLEQLKALNFCFTLGALDAQNNLIAGNIYLLFKNRITFILNGNSAKGLTDSAAHLLQDYIINKFAGTKFILDFEGSDFSRFARFYEQYGAFNEPYFFLRYNHLAWPFKYFK